MRIDGPVKWYGAAGLASMLVLVAGWLLLVSPQRGTADDLSAQADSQVQANQVAEAQVAALKEQYKTFPTLQEQLALAQTHLPQTPQLPSLLRQLDAAAASAGVTLNSVSPGAPTPLSAAVPGGASAGGAGQLNVIPLSIAINGGFANTRLFIADLEALPRSLLVTGLSIARSTGSTTGSTTAVASSAANPLATTLTARVFSSTPTAPSVTSTTSSVAAPAPAK